MNTYGFSKMSIRKLKDDLTPDTGNIIEIKGAAQQGATSSFDITGLTKEAVKVYGSNKIYYMVRKGVGEVAANFGVLDLPFEAEGEILGYSTEFGEGIQGIGEDTEAPYTAVVIESENLHGEPVAFALVAGSFSRNGISGGTINDSDFTPEPGEYVFTAMSRDITIDTKTKNETVLRAVGAAAVTALKNGVLGKGA